MLKKYKTSLLGIECKKSQAKEFFMELKKKYIHMSHEKGRAMEAGVPGVLIRMAEMPPAQMAEL